MASILNKIRDTANQAKDAATRFADEKGIRDKVSGAAAEIRKAYNDTAASMKAYNEEA